MNRRNFAAALATVTMALIMPRVSLAKSKNNILYSQERERRIYFILDKGAHHSCVHVNYDDFDYYIKNNVKFKPSTNEDYAGTWNGLKIYVTSKLVSTKENYIVESDRHLDNKTLALIEKVCQRKITLANKSEFSAAKKLSGWISHHIANK